MKKIFFVLLVIVAVLYSQTERKSTLFVPSGSGFVRSEMITDNISLNKMAENIGCHPDQVYFSMLGSKENGIKEIGFEIFSNNIVFVLTSGDRQKLSDKEVREYLGDFTWKDKFEPYTIEYTLDDAIQNKSLTVEFIAGIFGIKEYSDSSVLSIPQLGYRLTFRNGLLAAYVTDDCLNKWAKEWKENFHSRYLSYKREAEKYWGASNEAAVINEINMQADAFAHTTDGYTNKYIKLFTSPEGNVNFKMLLVLQEDDQITLEEFFTINHGRYNFVKEKKNADGLMEKTYKVNSVYYIFSENGKLIKAFND